MKAKILEEHHLAGLEGGRRRFDLGPDTILKERHGTAEELFEARRYRLERVARIRLALGPPEVRGEQHARSSLEAPIDGGKDSADPRVLGDPPAFEGDIEVHPEEDTLPRELQLLDGQRGQSYRLLAMSRSALAST